MIIFAALFIAIFAASGALNAQQTPASGYKHGDDAIASWQGLIKISPSDHQAVGQLSSMLVSAGRFDEALKVTQNALAVSPDDIDIRIQNKTEGSKPAKELPVALLNADQLNNVAWSLAETQTDLPLAVDYAQRSVTMDEATLRGLAAPVGDLNKMRTIDVAGFSRPQGTAEFFVLISKKDVEDVSFISGTEEFSVAKDSISKASFDMPIPDDGAEKIARRGILSCSQYTKPNCQLVLLLPANTKVQ